MARHGGFPGMGMGMNANSIMQLQRQAQKLQQQMTEKQAELETREFEASAGGGVVTAKVSGKKQLISLTIKPEAIDPDDAEMLQDTIMAAVNEALKLADEASESEMGKLTGGLNIPGLF